VKVTRLLVLKVLAAALICLGAPAVGLFALQNLLIFPALWRSLAISPGGGAPPPRVESIALSTGDGRRITLWYFPASELIRAGARTALLLHDRGDTLTTFFPWQEWFQARGFNTYALDYRGFGGSSGWPTEDGLYRDVDRVWTYLVDEKQIEPRHLFVFGQAVGAALGSSLAAQHHFAGLVLLGPFTSFPDLLKNADKYSRYSALARFVRYQFPTNSFLAEAKTTCVGIVQLRESGFVAGHAAILKETIRKSAFANLFVAEGIGREAIFGLLEEKVLPFLETCG
jgi:uncharacterized protein